MGTRETREDLEVGRLKGEGSVVEGDGGRGSGLIADSGKAAQKTGVTLYTRSGSVGTSARLNGTNQGMTVQVMKPCISLSL